MKFNENLKYLRKREGLTQEELAEKLNVSRQSVTKWESGQALPDIEKVKEIAYMFSVSVDSLVGDIENPTTNKIKKKIDDIGWFIFGFIILEIAIILSLHNFLFEIIPNKDIAIAVTIIMVIIGFIIFVGAVKKYLKENSELILNMKEDEEGKKERKKYLLKRYCMMAISWYIFCFVSDLQFLVTDKALFVKEFIQSAIFGTVLDVILGYCEYISLEKKVKELNK